jgi:hypothetical protein
VSYVSLYGRHPVKAQQMAGTIAVRSSLNGGKRKESRYGR